MAAPILFHIKNKNLITLTINCANPKLLQSNSEFFDGLISNLSINEREIVLEEDDPIESSKFLVELIKYSLSNNDYNLKSIKWNNLWAELSFTPKDVFTAHFSTLGANYITMMLSTKKEFRVGRW
jgi:hypothetical protein